jgi:hypothetical protein
MKYTTLNTNLEYEIPEYTDLVDIEKTFQEFADSIPSAYPEINEVEVTLITSEAINKVFVYTNQATVNVQAGLPVGFQFAIANIGFFGEVAVTSEEIIMPVNSVKPNCTAILTKVTDEMWIKAVG